MLLPDKHIEFGESLVGLGTYVLGCLKSPATLDQIWAKFQLSIKRDEYPAAHSFDNIVLAVDLLFAIGAVEETAQPGVLRRCD